MTYSPPRDVMPALVGSWTEGIGPFGGGLGSAVPTSTTYENSQRVVYQPIRLPHAAVVRRFWWANGATTSASYNVDIGVYADVEYKPGAKIIGTGNTAQGTATVLQFVDVTDTTLAPGRYWIGIVCDSGTATFFRGTMRGSLAADASRRFVEEAQGSLPATATPVESANQYVYVCGFATTASP